MQLSGEVVEVRSVRQERAVGHVYDRAGREACATPPSDCRNQRFRVAGLSTYPHLAQGAESRYPLTGYQLRCTESARMAKRSREKENGSCVLPSSWCQRLVRPPDSSLVRHWSWPAGTAVEVGEPSPLSGRFPSLGVHSRPACSTSCPAANHQQGSW